MTHEAPLFAPSPAEIERRYRNVRQAMSDAGLDYLIVSGSEYSGFEGAVRYMSGFRILHRYAYVLVPLTGDPVVIFPKEAFWVGTRDDVFLEKQEFPAHCGAWLADYLKSKGARKTGVYGLSYIMNVRDYGALVEAGVEMIDFDIPFDYARAQKSEEELLSVRHSMEINKAGAFEVASAWREGMTEEALMAVAEKIFTSSGTIRNTMDMLCTGPNGSLLPQMIFPRNRVVAKTDAIVFGLEVAGRGGHWIEFSRPMAPNGFDAETAEMFTAYQEFHSLVEVHMKAGTTAAEVYHACMKPFVERGYDMGHVCGHSIGMTMIEMPRIGEGYDFVLPENMVCSMHPHIISKDRTHSLYFQETYRVAGDRGEALSGVPIRMIG